mgnify:FL=1|tara:strand:+ start:180 stop:1256 length:1077 start_codon:yes stop_codon:yes gene_type:complete
MLNFLPYALAAYGGYQGYKRNKEAGASGLNRILGGITGAAAGYYGGKGLLQGGSALNVPGFKAAADQFTPFTQIPGISQMLPQVMRGQQASNVLQAGAGTGDAGVAEAIAAADRAALANQTAQTTQSSPSNFLQKLLMRKRFEDGVDTGEMELSPGKLGTAIAATTFLSGAFDRKPQDIYTPTYNVGYAEFAKQRPKFSYIDPTTGVEKPYDDIFIPEANQPAGQMMLGPYALAKTTLKEGGLATIPKFNQGGINYLPSKVSHDENDANNYVRASGYVEDGSGNGDKDEDTMLAQLADGEFVTRADGVLGAGILAGGNPNSMKDMREKGAQYFYEQQKRFKRIFDIIEGKNAKNSPIN